MSEWEKILMHPSPLGDPNWVELSHHQCGKYTVFLHSNDIDWIACLDGNEIGSAATENGAKALAQTHMKEVN